MIFSVLKNFLLIILLSALNVNLAFCNPADYQSVNYDTSFLNRGQLSPGIETQLANWYTYEIVTRKNNFIRPAAQSFNYHNFDIKPPAAVQVTKVNENPWIRYKLEEIKDITTPTTKKDETVNGINDYNEQLYNLNNKHLIPDNKNNNRDNPGHPETPTILKNSNGDSPGSAKEPKRKSEIKCEEYGNAIGRKVWALLLVGTKPEGVPVSSKNARCEGLHTPLIVGGSKAQANEFPHMAALGWSIDGAIEYLCGGSLISERWVLTAAHCTHSPSGSPSVVRLGTNVLSDDKLGQLFEIKNIKKHPNYKSPAMYADIALLELRTLVIFNEHIRPTCLYQEFDTAPPQAWVAGWGVTQIGDDNSDVLLKAQLNILDNVRCARQYNRSAAVPRGIVPSMICAGDSNGDWKSDTCQGDSGGPLQIIHPRINCLYQIVGITSFGKLCALRDSPGIYTRVSQYLDWIEGIAWPENP